MNNSENSLLRTRIFSVLPISWFPYLKLYLALSRWVDEYCLFLSREVYLFSWKLFCDAPFCFLTPRAGRNNALTFDAAAAAAQSLQSCPTLCNPIDSSPPGSLIPGILQARTLEWVAISFSNAWKWKVKVKSLDQYLNPNHVLCFSITPNYSTPLKNPVIAITVI